MDHFVHVGSGFEIGLLLEAIHRQPELWTENRLRQMPGSPHVEADSIWLRFNEDLSSVERVFDSRECVNYPAWEKLPEAAPLIAGVMSMAEADHLGRCMLTRLPPGARITPHVDEGRYSAYYDRFHIVLAADEGSVFHAGGERVVMRPGDLWWFNNKVEHSVENRGAVDRIHLIIDLH